MTSTRSCTFTTLPNWGHSQVTYTTPPSLGVPGSTHPLSLERLQDMARRLSLLVPEDGGYLRSPREFLYSVCSVDYSDPPQRQGSKLMSEEEARKLLTSLCHWGITHTDKKIEEKSVKILFACARHLPQLLTREHISFLVRFIPAQKGEDEASFSFFALRDAVEKRSELFEQQDILMIRCH